MALSKDLPPSISTDLFLNGKLKVYQSKEWFKSGSDAVFLSAFPHISTGSVLEVGCGTGVVSLCLARQFPNIKIEGIDIQKELVMLAQENAKKNNLASQCKFTLGDISSPPYEKQTFDHVVTNPPYFNSSSPSSNRNIVLAKNHVIPSKNWIHLCTNLVKPRGFIYCIYPTAQIEVIIQSLNGFGGVTLFPLWPKENTPSKRVLIKAQKSVTKPSAIHKGMVVHNEDGTYTKDAESILREGKRIIL